VHYCCHELQDEELTHFCSHVNKVLLKLLKTLNLNEMLIKYKFVQSKTHKPTSKSKPKTAMKSSTIAYIFFTMWMSFTSTFGMAASNDMERNLRVTGTADVDTSAAVAAAAATGPTPKSTNIAEYSGPELQSLIEGYEGHLASFKTETGERELQTGYYPPRYCTKLCIGYLLGRCHMVHRDCWPW
jgi:hypothetical protein